MASNSVGPDPQNVRIAPGESYDFIVMDGLSGTRYWPKMRCDGDGNKCGIGESGGPGELCGIKAGCAPPVDTKFEASFGQNGVDWVDISLVDGFTLPFKFEMNTQHGKNCSAGDGNRHVTNVVDCSALSFDHCPAQENLGEAGVGVDLQVTHPDTEQTVGCYSPCSKLTLGQWGNKEANGRTPWDDQVKDYCCPTPPESPKECRTGPVKDTAFVKAVHQGCPGVYGYAYDDGMGLLLCPDDTKYKVTFFCPQGGQQVKKHEPRYIEGPQTPQPAAAPVKEAAPVQEVPAAPAPAAPKAPAPAPTPKPLIVDGPEDCESYMSSTGCAWTHENSCPGQSTGTLGMAGKDGSLGYACCCDLELWRGFPPKLPAKAPAPAAKAGEEQPSRLRITNGCQHEAMWIAHEAVGGVGPDKQNIKIAPGQSFDFTVYDGLTGTRYWPKMRCDEKGDACKIGESGGAHQVCGIEAGCAPPVDTKFEASFGQSGEDWVDISLVDGWTLPFKFEMKGDCSADIGGKTGQKVIDCSGLTLDLCPTDDDLGLNSGVDLRAIHPDTQHTVGCYSPCSKLTLSEWSNHHAAGRTPWDDDVKDYCCPTPPESPHECREGPVKDTAFVKAVHQGCPGLYGYAYDDGLGLLRCPSDTRYEVTFFCPADSGPNGPPPPAPAPAPEQPAAASHEESTAAEDRLYAIQGCHTLTQEQCCRYKDGRAELYGDDCVVVRDVTAPERDIHIPCQPSSWVDGRSEWVGVVVGCPNGHANLPIATTEPPAPAPSPVKQVLDFSQDLDKLADHLGTDEKVKVVLAVFDRTADQHLNFEEINELSTAAGGGKVTVDTYQRFCDVFSEEENKGLGFQTLEQVYAKSGTLDRDFKTSLQRLRKQRSPHALRTTAPPTTTQTTTVTTTTQPPATTAESSAPLLWQVVVSGMNVRDSKSTLANVEGAKLSGAMFRGWQEGDWVRLADESGFVMIENGGRAFLEKVPTQRWRVVHSGGVVVRSERHRFSKVLGTKPQGSNVFGAKDGDWLKLADSPGYVLISDTGLTFLVRDGETSTADLDDGEQTFVQHLLNILRRNAVSNAGTSQDSHFISAVLLKPLLGASALVVAVAMAAAAVRQRRSLPEAEERASPLVEYELVHAPDSAQAKEPVHEPEEV